MTKIVFTISLLTVPCLVFAQLPPGGGVGAPIDGGVSGLLIAAGVYGARKVYNARKK